MFIHTSVRKTVVLGAAGAAAITLGSALLHPATAQAVVEKLVAMTCHDPTSCVSVTNASRTGNAIVGVAQNAAAIVGQTNVNKNRDPNMFPPVDTNGGVTGVDASSNMLDTNAGVYGTAKNGTGVIGLTTFDSSVNNYGQLGVLGIDNSNTVNQNSGVAGVSNYNTGVTGLTLNPNGAGVVGIDGGGVGVFGFSESSTLAGVGVFGVVTLGNAGSFTNSDPVDAALSIDNEDVGDLVVAFGGLDQKEVMSLDSAGDMILAGSIQTGGSPTVVSPTSAGRKVLTYTSQQSVRTVDDVGEAQLVGGQATVRLDPTFASAIDTRSPYLVFITPQGRTSGLYVTDKTPSGFAVKEYDGSSNIAFDYRIVAKPFGSLSQRMPPYVARADAAAVADSRLTARMLSTKHLHLRP